MRLLDRYLLREFLVPLFVCLGAFLIFWIAFDIFSELRGMQEEGMTALDVAQYYLFKTPEFLILVLPVALLLAMLYTLTNHARYNEITAIRTAGVSLIRLCFPYLVIGVLASFLLFALDEFCVPRTSEIAQQLHTRFSQRRYKGAKLQPLPGWTFKNSRDGRDWFIGNYNQLTGEMIKPHVEWHLADGSTRSVDAERAIWTNHVWTFFQAKEIRQSPAANSFPIRKPVVDAMAFPEFSETPEIIRSEIVINNQLNNPSQTRRADIPVTQIFNYLRLHPQPDRAIRAWIFTRLHGRFAGPCACFVVVLVAIPFAAASGRRNVFVGVAASILIFFAYYVLQQLGFHFGETGQVPPWLGAWLPNLTFGFGSLWMIARVR